MFTPARIIWHHSAAEAPLPQFDAINQWHKARQFPRSSLGYYVGYHYVIEKDGTVKQARAETEIGAHDQGENINSLGICLVGNFSENTPTYLQEQSFARLLGELMERHSIPVSRIEPHRWDDTTECPGKLLPDNYAVMLYLKNNANPLVRFFWWVATQYKLL